MASSDLQGMYQELILDHSRTPHGFGLRDAVPSQSHQLNPTCGDEITLQVHTAADGTVEAIAWEGHGCAISQASASLFAELVEGLPVADVEHRIAVFREAMRSRGRIAPDPELLGDAAALGGVSKYVARVKCAMLGWVAAEDALRKLP
ncbi:SUF system NifU family Fe-S cluster assembly protein [Microbacterium esteraromaticum]|uniref:SUF system NifU family Fe-S cluster assembly protein n=1 Tax=Microbacterium esteraromaticum TaxID=57043 RepID=A0A939DWU3_9MICO|nr:SUF system NifU family Fe-S cluster assembly protein [Microbacterium esteraromaticum]MBN8206474.1 SUF system NifU family Fe-S cluster assembly protein [Microbacterium esteraromaticum]MBN8416629.1 SUF system NifU family Fe-S cluster assembly protein [Microbacterium esteraromaticum]MCA1308025.1 SUF system NifU family Fe-S cluster assembly protein [Microbacterium esteraromaticum]